MKIRDKFPIIYITNFLRTIRLWMINLLLLRKHTTKKIFLMCDARGGSTILVDLLKKNLGKSAVIWEPFHLELGFLKGKMNLTWRPYINKNVKNRLLESEVKKLIELHNVNQWLIAYSSIKDFIKPNYVLFKFVRGNLMLPWFIKNLSSKVSYVYLIRHPVAVALSQTKGMYGLNQKTFKFDDKKYNIHYKKHEEYLASLNSSIERYVAYWFIHNLYLNEMIESNNIHVISYENLVVNPYSELKELFNFLGKNQSIDTTTLNKSSKTDWKNDFKNNPKEQIEKWSNIITEVEKNKVAKIFDYFNSRVYSIDSCYPKVSLN